MIPRSTVCHTILLISKTLARLNEIMHTKIYFDHYLDYLHSTVRDLSQKKLNLDSISIEIIKHEKSSKHLTDLSGTYCTDKHVLYEHERKVRTCTFFRDMNVLYRQERTLRSRKKMYSTDKNMLTQKIALYPFSTKY